MKYIKKNALWKKKSNYVLLQGTKNNIIYFDLGDIFMVILRSILFFFHLIFFYYKKLTKTKRKNLIILLYLIHLQNKQMFVKHYFI